MHRVGLSVLEYALFNDAPFCVLCGEVGSGKSTLVELLIERKPPEHHIMVVQNTHTLFGDILTIIGHALGVDALGDNRFAVLRQALTAMHQSGRLPVLVIDEAQNLSVSDLEAIRLLTNLSMGERPLVQILLVGQTELRDTLSRPELRQLLQRISADYYLKGLAGNVVENYIRHREQCAGANESRFTRQAVEIVACASRGVPRIINVLCDLALVYAFGEGVSMVSRTHVDQVVREKRSGGLFWGNTLEGEQRPLVQEAG